jgi:hypothetical protein
MRQIDFEAGEEFQWAQVIRPEVRTRKKGRGEKG